MQTSVYDILPGQFFFQLVFFILIFSALFLGVLNPRESAKWIVENSDAHLICLDEEAIERAAKLVNFKIFSYFPLKLNN
jgi:hypothetical protein